MLRNIRRAKMRESCSVNLQDDLTAFMVLMFVGMWSCRIEYCCSEVTPTGDTLRMHLS